MQITDVRVRKVEKGGKMKAVVSIMGKTTDDYTAEKKGGGTRFPHLTWDLVKEMADSGAVEVQNHSYNLHGSHGAKRLRGEDAEVYKKRLRKDLEKMQRRTKEQIGYAPTAFTYPLGAFSGESGEVLRELGISASFSCTEGINILYHGKPDCLFMLKRNIRTQNRSAADIITGLK